MVANDIFADVAKAELDRTRMARERYVHLRDEFGPCRPNGIRRGLQALTARLGDRTVPAARVPRPDRAPLGRPAAR